MTDTDIRTDAFLRSLTDEPAEPRSFWSNVASALSDVWLFCFLAALVD